jgi:hypothetical protein
MMGALIMGKQVSVESADGANGGPSILELKKLAELEELELYDPYKELHKNDPVFMTALDRTSGSIKKVFGKFAASAKKGKAVKKR